MIRLLASVLFVASIPVVGLTLWYQESFQQLSPPFPGAIAAVPSANGVFNLVFHDDSLGVHGMPLIGIVPNRTGQWAIITDIVVDANISAQERWWVEDTNSGYVLFLAPRGGGGNVFHFTTPLVLSRGGVNPPVLYRGRRNPAGVLQPGLGVLNGEFTASVNGRYIYNN